MIPQPKIQKIAKVYFQNVSGNDGMYNNADVLATHFVTQLVQGAKDTEEYENELYQQTKSGVEIQLMFFLIKLLREFQTQKLKSSATSLHQQQSQASLNKQ